MEKLKWFLRALFICIFKIAAIWLGGMVIKDKWWSGVFVGFLFMFFFPYWYKDEEYKKLEKAQQPLMWAATSMETFIRMVATSRQGRYSRSTVEDVLQTCATYIGDAKKLMRLDKWESYRTPAMRGIHDETYRSRKQNDN